MDFSKILRHIPNFPEPGIEFIDITPVLADGEAFHALIEAMAAKISDLNIDIIIGAESRGFIMGAPLAYALGVGFIPVRKPGKLPFHTISTNYELEYGKNTLEMHTDAISNGQRVLIVDDLLATGGTAKANCKLVEELGGTVAALLFFIELEKLDGRSKLEEYRVETILTM
ncbi:MAG: adenine phosphoribosyltransferase [Clostridia bacterium]|nr:adenine phosphoribosyltransferase [Clostridia bacterium]